MSEEMGLEITGPSPIHSDVIGLRRLKLDECSDESLRFVQRLPRANF